MAARTLALCLVLAGCAQTSADVLDSRDDLHCALAAHTLEMNTDGISTKPQRQALYVLRSWYYSKLPEERLNESAAVIEAMKADPEGLLNLVEECVDRAALDKDWEGYSRWLVQTED
ncbi:hypothetical protein [Aurantiacibacter flavus]|uniref:Uncharacterized protein n=1 Tax=Aurantiacibacter flavus TaxID=3145232 RepID=A0ABV0CYD2_9SPHN